MRITIPILFQSYFLKRITNVDVLAKVFFQVICITLVSYIILTATQGYFRLYLIV